MVSESYADVVAAVTAVGVRARLRAESRNARIESLLAEAAGDRREAEWLFRKASRGRAEWCALCGSDLADTIYRRRVGRRHELMPTCAGCSSEYWPEWDEPRECAECGRLVFGLDWRRTGPTAKTCCEDHAAAFVNRRRRERRAERNRRSCECCGSRFVGTRSDSRYCSSKCRQKAYRERVTARGSDQMLTVGTCNGAEP